MPRLVFQVKVHAYLGFWSVMNMFDTRFESDLENCDLEDSFSLLSASVVTVADTAGAVEGILWRENGDGFCQ